MWEETFGRDALFLLCGEWLVAELEVLALSCSKDGYTIRTWIGRVPRSKGRYSGMASPSHSGTV